MPDPKFKYYFECVNCHSQYEAGQVSYLCPSCATSNVPGRPPKGVLSTKYSYNKIRKQNNIREAIMQGNYLDLLPIKDYTHWPKLRIGQTPIYNFNAQDVKTDFELFIKDDSHNPSYSFKDRASALVSAYASENDLDTIITASTGNAGSSISAICAAQGQTSIVMVPASAPKAKLSQICTYGAKLLPIAGKYDDAFDLSIQASEEFGWYNRNTAYNPFTIEGKKTVAFEIFQQMQGKIPDTIFVPVGDGVIIAGLYKGFEDLFLLGLIDKIPVMIAVQSDKSDNLVRNLDKNSFVINPEGSLADSITVDVPRNFYMTQKYMKQYGGIGISVSDMEILEAVKALASNYGLFAEPAAAAAMAGFMKFIQNSQISSGTKNLVLLTGSGLKDLDSLTRIVSIPDSIPANIESIKSCLI